MNSPEFSVLLSIAIAATNSNQDNRVFLERETGIEPATFSLGS